MKEQDMKKMTIIFTCVLLGLSCAGSPKPVPQPAAEPAPAEPLPDPKPAVRTDVTEAEVLDAVTRFDLATLQTLLEGYTDVKTIVKSPTLLLHLAEEAMGPGGDLNPLTLFLVGKKAYTLQRTPRGEALDVYINKFALAGTLRGNYITGIIGDGFDRYRKALAGDDLAAFTALLDRMPLDELVLLDAVTAKASAIVTYLLKEGIPALRIDPKTGENLLHLALNGEPAVPFPKRMDMVTGLVAAGADVNLKNATGDTPLGILLMAAFNDISKEMGSPEELIAFLVESGAAVNLKSSQNRSFLYMAANSNLEKTVPLFIEKGAEMDKASITGFNQNAKIMEIFINWGNDPAIFLPNIGSIQDKTEQLEFVTYLVDSGLNPKLIDPVRVAVNEAAVRYLVEKGADLAASTILYNWVLNYDGIDRIAFLVRAGADLSRTYTGGMTVLHLAMQKGNAQLITFLLDEGAPINARDQKGRTPLDYFSSKDPDLYGAIIMRGAKKSADLPVSY